MFSPSRALASFEEHRSLKSPPATPAGLTSRFPRSSNDRASGRSPRPSNLLSPGQASFASARQSNLLSPGSGTVTLRSPRSAVPAVLASDNGARIDSTSESSSDQVDKEKESSPPRSEGRPSFPQSRGSNERPRPIFDADAGKLPPWREMLTTSEMKRVLLKYCKFVGPGFLVAVAYIDPGNYATDVAAGASFRFSLLFMVLLSNIFAIFLQSLCVKLGSVTGMNLAENCRAHFPPWLNYTSYFFGEAAVIATDIAEVIGAAISLSLLSDGKIPLVAGCAISIADVFFILFFYNPKGGMNALRVFEFLIALLVLGVVVCFCFELSLIEDVGVGEVFRGYIPSSALVQPKGLFQACGILGATVMPHSLYLGSGIVQSRIRQFDQENTHSETAAAATAAEQDEDLIYKPSIVAIRSCVRYSTVELGLSLFTFALFVNSSILIVAGASLSDTKAGDASLFGIHDLLSETIAPAAGTLFAVALLLSGMSAGVVCTMAGQMVSEGQLNLHWPHWAQRLFTRGLSIIPSIIIAGALGQDGLNTALEASQVTLSVLLPFVSAPLLWFTCRDRYMQVSLSGGHVSTLKDPKKRQNSNELSQSSSGSEESVPVHEETISMANSWPVTIAAIVLWAIIVFMNVALIVLAGLGIDA